MAILKMSMLIIGLFLGYKIDRDISQYFSRRKIKIVTDQDK